MAVGHRSAKTCDKRLDLITSCAHYMRRNLEEVDVARGAALRKPTNVSARTDLVSEARTFGINLSEVFESALENAVLEARQKQWVEENRQAFADYDKFVETHGIFSDGKRLF
jgi:antitoxin CcdA